MREQLGIFLISAVIGLIGGAVYDVLSLACFPFKKFRFMPAVLEIVFCLLAAALFLFTSVKLHFPDFRLYMGASFLLGFVLYRKSFHKYVAFLGKIVYNEVGKRRKVKKCQARSGSCRRRKQRGSPSPQS